MKNISWVFVYNFSLGNKLVSIILTENWLYYLALHIRFASSSRFLQLVEIFAYETSVTSSLVSFINSQDTASFVVVYHFNNVFTQERIFLYVCESSAPNSLKLKTLGDVFTTSQWLERELTEMYGLCFYGKKDLRNLMLQYGDSSTPFRKIYPSIGLTELTYDTVTDTLVHLPISSQI